MDLRDPKSKKYLTTGRGLAQLGQDPTIHQCKRSRSGKYVIRDHPTVSEAQIIMSTKI